MEPQEPVTTEPLQTSLQSLFENARKKYNDNYIVTLLRVTGIAYEPDLLWGVHKEEQTPSVDLPLTLEVLTLVYNLIEQTQNRDYNPFPFMEYYSDGTVSSKLNLQAVVKLIVQNAILANYEELAKNIEDIFVDENIFAIENKDQSKLSSVSSFIKEVCELYFKARKEIPPEPRFHKLPQFEVLELLVDDEHGLYGFNRYFSNKTKANYERRKDRRTGVNVICDFPINYMVGFLDDLKPEYWVEDKRLYEIGLPGKYNNWGEWKPIVYRGETMAMQKEAVELADKDYLIAGIIFQMMCTGYRTVEFVVKTPIDMPSNNFSMDRVHLYKCPKSDANNHAENDYRIYDGYYELEETGPEYIRAVLTRINIIMTRWAFSYNSTVDVVFKYNMASNSGTSQPQPKNEDMKVLNSMLLDFPRTEDANILNVALEWHHQAKHSNGPVAFLCCFIALETIIHPVSDREADLGIILPSKENKVEKRERIKGLVQKRHDEVFADDPIKFVNDSYFFDIVGVRKKTEEVLVAIFGEDHEYVKLLFEKRDENPSLYQVRNKIAHGSLNLLNKKDLRIINEATPELMDLLEALLKKVILPGKEFPKWSQGFSMSIFPSDPRNALVVSDEKMLGNNDWKIRPEWLI